MAERAHTWTAPLGPTGRGCVTVVDGKGKSTSYIVSTQATVGRDCAAWQFANAVNAKVYVVRQLDNASLVCTCKGASYRRTCRHVEAIRAQLAESSCRRPPK